MEDSRLAVTRLVYTYADLVDRGDFEALADLLAHAELSSGDMAVRGRDSIFSFYSRSTRRYPDDGTPKTQHVTTNLLIDLDEEAGKSLCGSRFTVFQAVPGVMSLQPVVAGRYEDRFERVDGQWRFASRHIVVELFGDLGQHLRFEIPGGAASGPAAAPRA